MSNFPDIVARLERHVRSVMERFPDAARQAESFREQRGKALGSWPEWCFLPLSGAYAIATAGSDVLPDGPEVGVLGAILPWRLTKGVYEFDETLLAALWETPVTGELPAEVFERLPEWCCYIGFP